jgi:hypothetical protein
MAGMSSRQHGGRKRRGADSDVRVRLGSSRLFVNVISSSLHLRPYSASRKRERTADHDKITMCAPQALGGRRPHQARLACMAPLVPPVEEETNGERRFRSCPWAPKTSTPRSDVLARELLHSALIASPPRLCPAPLHILVQIHASPTNTVLLSP